MLDSRHPETLSLLRTMPILSHEQVLSQLRSLASIDPSAWNESDVREDLIAPLLAVLGYRRGTDYDINREGSHLLTRPWLFIGRQRIAIDYALMIRKKSFWIIEAKGASDKTIAEDAIFQAYFYALHPEVGARYFSVINGWRIQVFDVRTVGNDYTPILDMRVEELLQRFEELVALLGAGRIRKTLQERIVSDIRDVLSTEIEEERLSEFKGRVNATFREIASVVRQNRSDVFFRKHAESAKQFGAFAKEVPPEQIIRVVFELAVRSEQFGPVFDVFVSKLRALSVGERARILQTIDDTVRGRLTTTHRTNLIRVALRLAAGHDAEMRDAGLTTLSVTAEWAIRLVFSKYASDPLLYQLARMEATLYRVGYKRSFVDQSAIEEYSDRALAAKRILPEDDLVYLAPSVATERLLAVERFVSSSFHRGKDRSLSELEQFNVELDAFENELNAEFVAAFNRERSTDLSFYESYGAPFDYDVSLVASAVSVEFDAAQLILGEETSRLLVDRIVSRSEEYAVNHVDALLARYLLATRQFEITGSDADLEGGVSQERLLNLEPSFSFQKLGRNTNPDERGLKMTARLSKDPARFLQVSAELVLSPSPILRVLSSKILE